ncbi:hypothetical protein Q5752_000872 [Cryptotrichosporon argae]
MDRVGSPGSIALPELPPYGARKRVTALPLFFDQPAVPRLAVTDHGRLRACSSQLNDVEELAGGEATHASEIELEADAPPYCVLSDPAAAYDWVDARAVSASSPRAPQKKADGAQRAILADTFARTAYPTTGEQDALARRL